MCPTWRTKGFAPERQVRNANWTPFTRAWSALPFAPHNVRSARPRRADPEGSFQYRTADRVWAQEPVACWNVVTSPCPGWLDLGSVVAPGTEGSARLSGGSVSRLGDVSEEVPAVAGAQVAGARSGSTWGSALASQEFAAIGGVGFEPVGQALAPPSTLPGTLAGTAVPGRRGDQPTARRSAHPATQVSGQGYLGSFGPLVQAMYQARRTAIDRMTAECAALGGHGVVGVRLSRGPFSLGGLEFTAIGTAVRAPDAARRPRTPFTCGVSGQEFAKLIMAGWVPAGLASASRSGRGTMTGRPPARPAGLRATSRSRLDRAGERVAARRQAPAGR